jgi:hypothetical protein
VGRFGVSRPFDASASVGARRGFQVSGGPEAILRSQAVLWLDALYSNAGQTATNLGTGGTAMNAQLGSTASADSNDPLWLANENQAYVYLPGSANNNMTTPDAAALDVTGDLDVRVWLAADDWTPASTSGLFGKWDTASNNSWLLWVNAAGTLSLFWTANGSTNNSATSTVATGVSDGQPKWVRATLDVDNGASGRDIKFFTSDDGTTWTQLGTTVTQAGVTSVFSGTSTLKIGDVAGTRMAGKFYRAQLRNGIDGTVVFDANMGTLTTGSATSFTESSSNAATVTINRATSGRKSVAVVRQPVWLFGSDDYMEIPDNADLDFIATDSFTVVAVARAWNTQGTNDVLVAKKAGTTQASVGYVLMNGSSTALQGQLMIADGSNQQTAVTASRTVGAATVVTGVRNVAADNLIVYAQTVAGNAATDNTTATLANAEVLRVGRLSGAATEYADVELIAAAVFRRVLSSDELRQIVTYYQTRYA